ncbi:MAG TPA: energy-coupling factor transporter transmembrane component T [Burkholderiales bacterium]|nr:energy-coupling factor transporter transmembrane component T [Burkholderiales bacterium]
MLDFFSLHPATRILLWVSLVVFTFSTQAEALFFLTLFLAVLLILQRNALFFRLLRRIRWILVSLFFIYAFETPGNPVFHSGPTMEGLISGGIQAWRIVLTIGFLAFLHAATSREKMLSGIYTLLLPFKRWIKVERIAVRLLLTLHYAEEGGVGNWRERMKNAFDEKAFDQSCFRLPLYSFRMRDGAALLTLASILML